MKLISINIECNRHTKLVLNFLKKEKPDVICLQEFLEEDFEFYKKELGLKGVFQQWNYSESSYYKDLVGKRQGLVIFTDEIIESGFSFYQGGEENILKPYLEYMSDEKFQNNKAFVWVDIKDKDNNVFKFVTTQLPVTKEGNVTQYQIKVIESLLSRLDNLEEFILCGDMNAPRGRESFSLISEKYKDNIPLEYKTSIDQNLHKVKDIQFMVDGLFTTPRYIVSMVKLIDGVSDHMAIVAQIDKV